MDFSDFPQERTIPTLPIHLDAPICDLKLRRSLCRRRVHMIEYPSGLYPQNMIFDQEELERHSRMDKYTDFDLLEIQRTTSLLKNKASIGFQPIQHYLFRRIPTDVSIRSRDHMIKIFKKFLILSIQNIKTQWKGLDLDPNKIDNLTILNIEHNPFFKELVDYFICKIILEQGSLISGCKSNQTGNLHKYGWNQSENSNCSVYGLTSGFQCYNWKNISIIKIEHQEFIGTRNHFLEISDVASQRFMILLSSIVGEILQYPTYIPPSLAIATFNWGDQILFTQGNNGYSSLSMWESLLIGFILHIQPDDYINNTVFLNQMEQEFIEKNPHNKREFDSLMQMLDPHVANPNILFQLFGLYRVWGHPTVDAKEGIKKLKLYACKDRPFNYKKIELINRKFNEYFCCSYYNKNSSWPQLDTTELMEGSYLKKILENNLPIQKNHPQYQEHEWRYIKSKKTFEIPKQYDVSEMISDKAMSFDIKRLVESLLRFGNIGRASDRSVLIQWIQSDLGDPEEFLRNIDQNGFPEFEVVIGVCPKERELKIQARLFSLLTLVKRMYVVITEALIADNILPYFQEITMKDDQAKLLLKHYKLTKRMGQESDYVYIILNSDFEKWNSNMRYEETTHLFSFMDGLFGYSNVINRTHEMFTQSTLYLADGSYCPKVIDGRELFLDSYVWQGHLGGLEGLRQKGWTVWTVVILKYITEVTGVKCRIMGQGDNQVLICEHRRDLGIHNIQQIHANFVEFISEFLSDLGPPLKREETWCSSQLFMYGKYCIYKGVPMTMSQKKICRMMKVSNEGYPTIESCLSSLSASFFDSTWTDTNFLVPFFCYSFETLMALDFHLYESTLIKPYIKESLKNPKITIPDGQGGQRHFPVLLHPMIIECCTKTKNHFLLSLLMLFPRVLGGYPISLLGDVMIRGFSDPITLAIAQLKKFRNSEEKIQVRNFIEIMQSPILNLIINHDLLFEDPTSLNLFHPSTPGDQIKRLVLDMIQDSSFPKSQTFTHFLNHATQDQDDLKQLLLTMTPHFNPRIAHECLEATVTSKAKSMLERVEKTNTLVGLMTKGLEFDLNKRLHHSEVNFLSSVLYQLSHASDTPVRGCATEHAQELRELSWRLNITGVTVACPIEFLRVVDSETVECKEEVCPNLEMGKVLIKSLLPENINIYDNLHLGPSPPYIGKRTQIKNINQFGRSITKLSSPLLKRCSKLLQLIGWGVDYHSNFATLLRIMLSSITDLTPMLLELKEAQMSGSVEHRFNDESTKHGCYLPILYTSSSWITINTSTLSQYSKGSANVNLNFQSILILIESLYNTSPWTSKTMHGHINCDNCIIPIYEGTLDIDTTEELDFPTYENDPYFWISSDSISLIYKAHADMNLVSTMTEIRDSIPEIDKVFASLVAQKYLTILRQYDHFDVTSDNIQYAMDQIPIIWVLKMNFVYFIKSICILLFSMILFHNLQEFTFRDINKETVIELVQSYITRISDAWFSPLTTLFFNPNQISKLVQDASLIPPGGCPPSLEAKCRSIKNCIIFNMNLLDQTYFPMVFQVMPWPELSWCWVRPVKAWLLGELQISGLKQWRKILPIPIIKETGGLVRIPWIIASQHTQFSLILNRSDKQFFLTTLTNNLPYFIEFNLDNLSKHLPEEGETVNWELNHEKWKRTVQLNKPLLSFKSASITLWPTITTIYKKLKTDSISMIRKVNSVTLIRRVEFSTLVKKANLVTDISYVSFLRPKILTTTAIYKSLSLLSKININRKERIICCGDGAGSFTLSSLLLGHKNVWYNSVLYPKDLSPQGLTGYSPSDLYYFPHLLSLVQGIEGSIYGISDLTHPSWGDNLEIGESTLIVCDAEFGFGEELKMILVIKNLLKIIIQQKCGLLIKLYYLNLDIFMILVQWLQSMFKKMKIFRSGFSNDVQTEVYIWVDFLEEGNVVSVEFQNNIYLNYNLMWSPQLEAIVLNINNLMTPNFKALLPAIKLTVHALLNAGLKIQDKDLMLRNFYSIPSNGVYPLDTIKWWDNELAYLFSHKWQTYKNLSAGSLSYKIVQDWILRHLFVISGLVESSDDFKSFLHIISDGYIYFWKMNNKHWRTGIGFKNIDSKEYTDFFIFRIKKKLTRNIIKTLLTDISLFNLFNKDNTIKKLLNCPDVHTENIIKYTVKLSNPLLSSKFSKKDWYQHTIVGYGIHDLPSDERLALVLLESKFHRDRTIRIKDPRLSPDKNPIFLQFPTSEIISRIRTMHYKYYVQEGIITEQESLPINILR